jgi:UDP-N-acetylglucosamine:LPS N-acetylglucosamine transferase
MSQKPRILVCPLDWGLGHAVRCVPVIRELINAGAEPIIAADAAPLRLLRQEFPDLSWIKFPGVPVRYPANGSFMPLYMALQTPTQLLGLAKEKRFIKKVAEDLNIQGIISDNRYGAFSARIPSVFITHQLNIQTGFILTDFLIKKLNKKFTGSFSKIWVPDFEGDENLSGQLSHGVKTPENTKFIGPLSRFSKLSEKPKIYDAAMILSGPEPQRTRLENLFLDQVQEFPDGHFLLIRGLEETPKTLPANVNIRELADSEGIQNAYALSKKMICRSGYTSVMELYSLGLHAHLIPTPGQTEQEYLARYLSKKGIFTYSTQSQFNLRSILQSEDRTLPKNKVTGEPGLTKEIRGWLSKLTQKQVKR